MEFWWASLIVAVLFVVNNVLIFTVFKGKRELCHRTVVLCCIFILAYKVIYYTYMQIIGAGWSKFPVEYSALTYFLFTIVVFTKCDKLMPFAIFSAIVAGVAYNLSFIFSVNSFLPPDEPIFEYVFAWLNHSLLYFCGMLLLLYVQPLDKRLWWEIPLGVAVFAGYAAIMENTVLKEVNMETVIYALATGNVIDYVAPALNGKWYFYIWYYPAFAAILSGVAILMFKFNTAKKYLSPGGGSVGDSGAIIVEDEKGGLSSDEVRPEGFDGNNPDVFDDFSEKEKSKKDIVDESETDIKQD